MSFFTDHGTSLHEVSEGVADRREYDTKQRWAQESAPWVGAPEFILCPNGRDTKAIFRFKFFGQKYWQGGMIFAKEDGTTILYEKSNPRGTGGWCELYITTRTGSGRPRQPSVEAALAALAPQDINRLLGGSSSINFQNVIARLEWGTIEGIGDV